MMGQSISQMSSGPAAVASGNYRWWLVGMLWLVCLFNYADRQAIFSTFPLLKEEMGLNDVQLGVVGSAFMWVYAAALPLAGIVGDRWSRKALILGGLAFWSIVTLLTALSRRYEHLVLFRALEGLGEAFYMPASLSLISDYHGPETRSRAMGLHQSSVYAGTVLGGTVAGLCADYYGWRSGFYLFGSVGVVLAAVLLFFLREPPPLWFPNADWDSSSRNAVPENARNLSHSQHQIRTYGEVAKDVVPDTASREQFVPADVVPKPSLGTRRFATGDSVFRIAADIFRLPMVLLLMAVFVGANFVAMIFLTWLPSYLNRRFGMSLTLSGLNATLWLQAASVVGVLIGGWLADRWTRRRRGGRMLVQAIGLFAGAPLIFLTGWTLSVPVLVAALAGFGLFKGFYDANIWAALYDFVPKPRRASAMGFMNAIGWLGGGTAPVLIALAAERFGMSKALSATSLIYVLFGTLLLLGLAGAATANPHPPGEKQT